MPIASRAVIFVYTIYYTHQRLVKPALAHSYTHTYIHYTESNSPASVLTANPVPSSLDTGGVQSKGIGDYNFPPPLRPMRFIPRPSPGAMFIVYRLRPALLVANDSLENTCFVVVSLFLYLFKLFVVMVQ